jgi:hypothetical protein
MSTLGYFLTTSISVAKEIGIVKAPMFPIMSPVDKELPNINIMPDIARIIETRVIEEIFSFKKIYPNIAKKIVCVCIIKLALATVVLYMENTYPQNPIDKIKPPKKPGIPES